MAAAGRLIKRGFGNIAKIVLRGFGGELVPDAPASRVNMIVVANRNTLASVTGRSTAAVVAGRTTDAVVVGRTTQAAVTARNIEVEL